MASPVKYFYRPACRSEAYCEAKSEGREGLIANVRPANLPNSLRKVIPLTLVFSTYPPVSVVGTDWLRSRCDTFFIPKDITQLHFDYSKRWIHRSIKHTNGFSN